MQSESVKATTSPRAAAMPALRAALSPLLTWTKFRTAGKSFMISCVLSFEPSSMKITS
jgi:hypothetical protein